MAFKNLWQAIQSQVKSSKKRDSNVPFLSELIDDKDFSNTQIDRFYKEQGRAVLQKVNREYQNFIQNIPTKNGVYFISDRGINGFALDLRKFDMTLQDLRNFQNHLVVQLKDFGYTKHYHKVETTQKSGYVECIYRYYLKPSYQITMTTPINQLFGNVCIELVSRNDKLFRLVVKVMYYSDRNYQKELPFDRFLATISNPIS